jgi:4-aminobutyrate aminotransferase-like enzyme
MDMAAKTSLAKEPSVPDAVGPKSREVIEMLMKYEVNTEWAFGVFLRPVVWDRADGCVVTDIDGNEYLDFSSGFATTVSGHSNRKVREALFKQAERLTHAPDSPTLPRALLAKKLAEIMPRGLKRSVFGLNGGDAIEIALKLARSYTKRSEIIAFQGGFHGRATYGCMSATSVNFSKKGCLPQVPGIHHVPYAYCYRCAFGKEYPECELWCADYIVNLLEGGMTGLAEPAALIVEPLLGAGGYVIPPDSYLPKLERICREHDLLFMVDEVQTAFGRYGGAITASETLGIHPDIITLGKGLTGGYPLSATVTTDEVASSWSPVVHSATYTGNPLMCAIGLAQIDVVQELKLPERAKKLEGAFRRAIEDNLSGCRSVGEISVKGLFCGIEIVEDKTTKKPAREEFMKRIADLNIQHGLMGGPPTDGMFHNRMNLAPPLIISEESIEKGAAIVGESVKNAEKEFL